MRPEIAKFVLSLGATTNMDGTALSYPCRIIFLAYTLGLEFDAGKMILVALLATVMSVGAAPIPNAGTCFSKRCFAEA